MYRQDKSNHGYAISVSRRQLDWLPGDHNGCQCRLELTHLIQTCTPIYSLTHTPMYTCVQGQAHSHKTNYITQLMYINPDINSVRPWLALRVS